MVADRDVRHENCSSKNGDQKLTTIFVYGLTPLSSFFDGPGGTPAFYPYLTPPPREPPPWLWPGYCGHVLSCPPLLLSLRHILSKKPLRFEFKLQRRWKKHTLTASLTASLLTDAILTLSNFCGTQLTTSPNEREPYLRKNDSSKNRQTRLTTRTRFSKY